MTLEHFQNQVVSALKGIEKVMRDNWGVRQEPVEPEKSDPVEEPPVGKEPKFTLAHICVRTGKTKLVPYPTVYCSMCCLGSSPSIDLFIEEDSFEQLENLLKKLS
jgi:hypothetical protein